MMKRAFAVAAMMSMVMMSTSVCAEPKTSSTAETSSVAETIPSEIESTIEQPTGMNDYYDYKNEDGSYSYYFKESGIVVTMSEEFYRKTRVVADVASAAFVHRDSYHAMKEEGYENGGTLFTIRCSVTDDFTELPEYTYLGYDEEECLNWFVTQPTDYQGYVWDKEINAEYQKLWKMTDEILIEYNGMETKVTGSGDSE